MVPPGEAASPFLSTAPAVFAPEVLASRDEGGEAPVVVPVAPFFMAVPPPVGLPFMLSPVVGWLAAGPPAVPPALCAIAAAPERVKAVASAIVVSFMVFMVNPLIRFVKDKPPALAVFHVCGAAQKNFFPTKRNHG